MPVPYTKRTIPELKTLLRERGYSGYSSLNKSQLIEMLRHQTPGGSKYEKSGVQKPAVVAKKRRSIGKKDCPSGSTRSPVTNRCRKDVVKKDCPAGSTRSPLTNRCRKDVVARPVIKPYGSIGIPRKFAEIAEDCSNAGHSKWVFDEDKDYISKGVAGSAFYACLGKDDCKYVVKKQFTESCEKELRKNGRYLEQNSYKYEMDALIDLQGWKHAPKIYAAWTCGAYAYFVMEKLKTWTMHSLFTTDMTHINQGRDEFYKKMVVVLEELKSRKWLHTDPHQGNIMLRENGDIVLIDYGRSRKFKNMKDTNALRDHPFAKINDNFDISEMYKQQIKYLRNAFSIPRDYNP
jgi:serine/threonine protein kinase